MNDDFQSKFCAHHRLAAANYESEMLRRSLYPAGRVLYLLIGRDAAHFSADRDFIRGVGRVSRLGDFEMEAWGFVRNPQNRGLLRRRLRMRVSAKKVYRLMREVLQPDAPPADGSTGPFVTGKSA